MSKESRWYDEARKNREDAKEQIPKLADDATELALNELNNLNADERAAFWKTIRSGIIQAVENAPGVNCKLAAEKFARIVFKLQHVADGRPERKGNMKRYYLTLKAVCFCSISLLIEGCGDTYITNIYGTGGSQNITDTSSNSSSQITVEHFCPGTEGEIDFDNDPLNCGACAVECPVFMDGPTIQPKSSPMICFKGKCKLVCNLYKGQLEQFFDCDTDPKNGCESNLIDPNNCGACGNKCNCSPPGVCQ